MTKPLRLTKKQQWALQMLANGVNVKKIAADLGLNPDTVHGHFATARKANAMPCNMLLIMRGLITGQLTNPYTSDHEQHSKTTEG